MDESGARAILGPRIRPDGGIYHLSPYMEWSLGSNTVVLEGRFFVEDPEAMLWWIRREID